MVKAKSRVVKKFEGGEVKSRVMVEFEGVIRGKIVGVIEGGEGFKGGEGIQGE